MDVSAFRFEPPDRRLIWKHLALTMSQASALTGVSERQIQHWMDRGYILPSEGGGRKISGESLDTILLIKQARGEGIPLREAVPLARAYLDREASPSLQGDLAQSALRDLDEMLASAHTGIENMQRLVATMRSTSSPPGGTPLSADVSDRVSSQRY